MWFHYNDAPMHFSLFLKRIYTELLEKLGNDGRICITADKIARFKTPCFLSLGKFENGGVDKNEV